MKHIILLSLVFILVGCGGGGSSGESPDANNSSSSASDVNDSSDSGSTANDSAAPLLKSITADPEGDKITFLFNESIVDSELATTDFQITQDGDSVAISNIAVDGGSVILTVSDLSNSALQVSYSPSVNPIQDLAGNSTASFTQLVVSDGYIRGAKVYADTNGNGIPDESELIQGLTSDALGQLVINGVYDNAEIIIKGGVNVDTGAINQLKLTAPVGYSVINPLSTLVQKIFASDDSQTIGQAENTLQEALGITLAQGKSLSSYDPISDVTVNAIVNRVATLQIATVLAIAAAADAEDVSNKSNIEAVALSNMVAIVKATDGKVTLNNETVRQIFSDDSDTILVSVKDLSDVTSAVVAMETIKQNPDFSDGQIDLAAEIAKIIKVQADAIDKVKPARPTLVIDANQLKISFNILSADGSAAVVGDTIQVLDGNEVILPYVLTNADIGQGYFSVLLSELGLLDTQLTAIIIDIAGNESDLSSATGIDTVPPSLTSAKTANFSELGVVYRAAIDDSTDTVDEITYSISDTTNYSYEQMGLAQSAVTIPALVEATQHVYVSSSTKSEDGTQETIVISYNALDSTTTGLGLRIHYDSSAININGISDIFQNGLLSPSSDPFADDDNDDGDTNTDQFVTFAWASLFSSWPNSAPVDLATITFDVDEDATGTSAINFTVSSNAAGFDFDGQPHNLALKTIKLSFDSASGALTLTSDLDLTLLPPFSFILTASDLAGNKSEQTVTLNYEYADKAGTKRIFDKGQVGPEWDTGIQGYDQDLNWESCSNPSGCPNIDWAVVDDDERGKVLEITHTDSSKTAGLYIMSSNPVDLRNAEIDGVLKLDIKVVSGDRNISFRPDCIYPCAGDFYSESINEYNQWQTVSVAVEDLIPNGPAGNVLDLEIVRSALVMEANSATKFRIDNAYFDCGEVTTCAGVSDLFVPVDWAATHEDPSQGFGNDETLREYPGYTMVWSDNFHGDAVDRDNWNFDIGKGTNGWGNGERQYYRQQNATVDNGVLIIEATKHVPYIDIGDSTGIQYTSARLVTRDKMEFKYGRVDIRAVVAEGQGMWSAGWMLGANHTLVGWPQSGEIDIFETIGGQNRESKMINNMFWNPYGSATQADIISRNLAYEYGIDSTNPNETFANQFHVFSLIWDEGTIQFEVDGVNTGNDIDLVGDLADTFRNPFYLLLNVAVGGTYPGYPDETTSFPDGMLVDYVRVYQRDSDGDGIADFELDGKTTLDQSPNAPNNP